MGNQNDIEQLCEQVERLTGEVRVLRDSLEELTTAVGWAANNGRIRIQFERAIQTDTEYQRESEPHATITLFDIGELVQFEREKEFFEGEIVDLNDGENVATIMLLPTGESVEVDQDLLERVEQGQRHDRSESDRSRRTPEIQPKSTEPPPPSPAPGKLF